MEKRLRRYLIIGIVVLIAIGILFLLNTRFTGNIAITGKAIYEQSDQNSFDEGTYLNTLWNGSAIVLSESNLTGTYTSKVFDAGSDAVWNNMSSSFEVIEGYNSFLTSAIHSDSNRTAVFDKDESYYLADMKDASKKFYLNFSENLLNGTILKIYSKKDKGVAVGIYDESDSSGTSPLGTFTVSSTTGDWSNISLNINSPTKSIWLGEGTESGSDPKENFDYIFAEVPGNSLTLYARSCDDSLCDGESWALISNPSSLGLSSNRYFQYKFEFETSDSSITPSLSGINIDYTPSIYEVYVDDDFNSGTEGWGITHFSNITSALNSISEGGTINVASGTYNEKFTISKSINLAGAGWETTAINGGGTGQVIIVNSNNVNISGFKVMGSGTTGGSDTALLLNSIGSCIINNNYFFANRRGISLVSSPGNTIHSNYFINQTEYGLYSNNWATQNNIIYNNYFSNSVNFYAASSPPALAVFNITKTTGTNIVGGEYIGGNYWNNYAGNNRGDGFGDTAHNLFGSYYDYLPLMDNSAPSINLIYPQDGATFGSGSGLSLEFVVSDSDENLDSCWYNINGENNLTLSGCANTTFNIENSGAYTLTIYANDTEGAVGSDYASFNVNLGSPTIILNSPLTGQFKSSSNIAFSYTPNDSNLDTCEFWGNFTGEWEKNQTESSPSNGVENTFNLNGLEDGTYKWNIWCNNTLGNSAFNGNQTFVIDTVNPIVTLSEPTGTKTTRTNIPINWNINEINPSSCKYNVYRGENIEVSNTSIDCSLESSTFSVTLDANFVLNFYATDSAGNTGQDSSSFTVDTSTPSTPTPVSSGGGGGGSTGRTTENISIISQDSIADIKIGKISDILANPGDNKIVILDIENIGKIFLNKCRIQGTGVYSDWIIPGREKNLAIGEESEFNINVNIPSNISFGKYPLESILICREFNKSINFNIEILKSKIDLKIIGISKEQENIKVSYSLEELSGINQEFDLQFLFFNKEGENILEANDNIEIKAKEFGEFNLIIPNFKLKGEFKLIININSKTYSGFIEENLILKETQKGISGFTILGEKINTRNITSGIIVLLFIAFAIFLVIKIFKSKK